jgi:hypothetical protein
MPEEVPRSVKNRVFSSQSYIDPSAAARMTLATVMRLFSQPKIVWWESTWVSGQSGPVNALAELLFFTVPDAVR